MEKISPPVRILAVVLVLVGVAGMLMLRTMGPSAEPVAVPAPAPAKPAPVKVAPAKPKAAKAAAPKPAKAVAPKAVAKPKPIVKPAVPPTGFPTVVDRALRDHEVLVVSLVVPGARVDELAAAEAEAGGSERPRPAPLGRDRP